VQQSPILARIERRSVVTCAYAAIRTSILDGLLRPGDQLIEGQLALDLDVSRGTVREALARLREDGLVEQVPPRGLAVRTFTSDDVIDIYNTRIGLETVAMRLCVRAGVDVAPLERHIEEMSAAARAGDSARLNERELAFHVTLCELSGNSYLPALLDRIGAQLRMALALDNAKYENLLEVAREHEPVVAAMRGGDEQAAAEALVEHIVGSIARHLPSASQRLVGRVPV
jgi:DNA-binding GntR family transcriptional regulator